MPAVKKHVANPILWANREHPWEAEAAFNGCPVQEGGRVHLLYRAESLPQQVGAATLRMSSIGHAVSRDGVHFSDRTHFLKPQEPWDYFGCEDPRVTKFEDVYIVCYTALSTYPFSADGIKVGVALTKDFKTIAERHLVTPFNAKAMALFPERVGGKIAAILTAHTDRPPAKIALALFDTLEELWSGAYWEKWHAQLDTHALALERNPNDHVEVGAPPIYTKEGWLLIYSYIRNYFSGQKLFGIEAVLLDLANPRKIIARTDKPLIVPEEDYELYGRVPQIVFPSGAFVKGDTLFMYYGAADTTCCLATCSLAELLGEMCLAAKLERFSKNPIITPRSDHNWEARATLNPGAVYVGGRVHVLYRAMSSDGTSTLGYATSKDGFSIDERLNEPVYVPREDFEKKLVAGGNSGCEDPRLTLIGEKVYMCYTAFDGRNVPRVALTSITVDDFLARRWNWKRPVLISPPGLDDKDAAIFPAKIRGKYAILHRLGVSVWIDFIDDLEALGEKKWLGGRILLKPRPGRWDSKKIGLAGPPIETPEGWLLLYHGVSKREDHHYHVRAALLDLKNPLRVIARTKDPIFEPEAPYEREGEVPNVVFPCGNATIGDMLFVYYGGADKVVGVAAISMPTLLNVLFAQRTSRRNKRVEK